MRGEKEHLYEEALKLKIQTNSFKDQNKLLKTQVKILERKLAEKDEMVNELFNQKDISTIGSLGQKLNKRKFENHLTSNLKKQVKEARQQVHEKDEELIKIKKEIKSTKLQELDLELRTYMDECLRLRHMLEETM